MDTAHSIRGKDQDVSGRCRSGQAIAEFVVSLAAILLLVAGILQIGELARAHTRTQMEAREMAGRFALEESYHLLPPGPRLLATWTPGPDHSRHSRDDQPVSAPHDITRENLLPHARPDELADRVPNNPFSRLARGQDPLGGFGLVHGASRSDSVPILPVVRTLLYRADAVVLESDVWLTWSEGLLP